MTPVPSAPEGGVKVWRIDPSGRTDFDIYHVKDTGRWTELMHCIEESLEQQFLNTEDGEIEWTDMKVSVTAEIITQEQYDEIFYTE